MEGDSRVNLLLIIIGMIVGFIVAANIGMQILIHKELDRCKKQLQHPEQLERRNPPG